MVADVIPHILMIGNRPVGLDYELSDTASDPDALSPGRPKQL